MQTMYPGQPNSPQTELAADITAEDTTIPLLNAAALPPAPNLAVIGTGEDAETVLYTGKSGNNLTGVTRGFQGAAKAWVQGTKVARNFTAYDYDALRQNVEDVAGDVDGKVSKSGDTMVGELSIQAPGTNSESAINLIDNTGIRKGRLFYYLDSDRIVFRKYAPSGGIAADVVFNESEFRYRVGSTYYDVWHSGNVPIETGSWTPELRFGGSTEGITYASRAGRYTRIANVVHWSFEIMLSSKGSASGIAYIVGLPFFKVTGVDYYHAVGIASNISVPSGQWLSCYVLGASVYLITNIDSDISSANFANNSTIGASGFYFIS